LEDCASELVDAAATAATAAATRTTDTMACTCALSARSFSLLLCLDRLASLWWNHLPMDWWWLMLLMELLLASICRKIQKYDN
jgi:hypothetical protein